MSLVPGLVLLHVSVTALLLVVLVAVIACQHATDRLRQRRARRSAVVPSEAAGATVLDWTIDLRTPAEGGGAVLQRTS